MSNAFLSRITLRHDASVQALARLLVPQGDGQQHEAAHHLLWALFGDDPERTRDFLWRQTEPGRFMVLSARQPVDSHGLFDIESRAFAPCLQEGFRLRFLLRANATIDRKVPGQTRSKRHDVVMDALYKLTPIQRNESRETLVPTVMEAWLQRQGARTGFALKAGSLGVEACDVLRIGRGQNKNATFGVVDVAGELSVTDPTAFAAALMQGFGRARAFGCGLMLIRRAG